MSEKQHLSLGAMDAETGEYVSPFSANKKNKYYCPGCAKPVIPKQGKIKIHHFAHCKSDSPCTFYSNSGESEIHRCAKLFMKTLLDRKKHISFNRYCKYCDYHSDEIQGFECMEITEADYGENVKAVIEHPFEYNSSNKKVDVALVEGIDKIVKYIFEIVYTHKTREEDRPDEMWVEINAESLLLVQIKDDIIEIECMRDYKCYSCVVYEEMIKKEREERWERERLEALGRHIEYERERFTREERRREEREQYLFGKEEEYEIERLEEEQLLERDRKQDEWRKQQREKERIEEEKWRKQRWEKERLEEEKREKNRKILQEIERIEEEKRQRIIKKLLKGTIVKSNEELQRQNKPCACGILIKNICICETPNYVLDKRSNIFYCNICTNCKCNC